MMLCKLSLKNIKKSFKDYAIYFFTLILGVSIFYIFNSLESQTVMMNISTSTKQIVKLMIEILSGVSVFVSFILGFLIIYASRFLIKRRNKEFGIYLTLGMSKGKISRILLIETFLIGVISLGLGLVIGVTLSQFTSIFVANMFDADLTKFTFIFSQSAFIKTIIYFGIMYLIVMIFDTVMVNKCKLIDLLHSNKKSENVKLKNPIICTIIFIIASAVLGYAYYLVTEDFEALVANGPENILIPIAMGIVSTFFIFWSISGLVLRIVMSMKKFYYKGLNSFTLRQISSKINTMVASITVICLMLFMTICILSSSLSIKNSFNNSMKDLVPMDIEIEKQANIEKVDYISNEVIEDSKISVEDTLTKLGLNVKENLKDITEVSIYNFDDFTYGDSFGDYLETVKQKYAYLRYDEPMDVMSLSDYNKIAKAFNNKTLSLSEGEYIIVSNYESDTYNASLKQGTIITVDENKYKPKFNKCEDGFIYQAPSATNLGIFVLPDSAFINNKSSKLVMVANYTGTTKEEKTIIENTIMDLYKSPYSGNTTLEATTKITMYEATIGLSAMATFVGLYLGIIFLMASAAILALKELSDSSDNKERFNMLRKLGADEKTINRALFSQIGIFFIFPLILAIIHSIFGIKFCSFILSSMGIDGLLKPIIMTSIFLTFIYGGYFIITYLCSKNIIKER